MLLGIAAAQWGREMPLKVASLSSGPVKLLLGRHSPVCCWGYLHPLKWYVLAGRGECQCWVGSPLGLAWKNHSLHNSHQVFPSPQSGFSSKLWVLVLGVMTSCFQWFESYLAYAAIVLWTSSRLFLLAEGLAQLSGPFCNVNMQSSAKERKELRLSANTHTRIS